MNAQEFNELLKLQEYDKNAKLELCCFCLSVIKRWLYYKHEFQDLESLSHSILKYFLEHSPKRYVGAPKRYLHKCVDNYLSTQKKRKKRTVALIDEISYEQRFQVLESSDIHRQLKDILGEPNATIIYMHHIDEVPEYEIAKIFGISYPAVRKRISRCKQLLKISLGGVTKDDL